MEPSPYEAAAAIPILCFVFPFLLSMLSFAQEWQEGGEQAPGWTNRLAHEKSVYLQQHAHNPVNWYPWGTEAFEKAKSRNLPIFLSIGYSTCHWCHVMERESFENEEIAAFLNQHFVCIKVDREERPDVDSIYMSYVMAKTGSGGWPMSVFLTPDRVPFYGGTYFPPEDGHGRPGFGSLLISIHQAWESNHAQIMEHGEQITHFLEANNAVYIQEGELGYGPLDVAVRQYQDRFDGRFGGELGAPKFPAPMMLGLLLRHELRTGDRRALDMVTTTLDRMVAGGIYDHLGGGFSRYSVDEAWLVPHFEKMLYGNAQLAKVYAEAFQRTGETRYCKVAVGILEYLLRDMRLKGGAFAAAEDADSEGEEGLFYTWTPDEMVAALGEELAQVAISAYGVTPSGHLDGRSVLHLPDLAASENQDLLEQAREKLFEVRSRRERPLRDDKVVSGWNGLTISAFAFCGRVFDEPRYLEAAADAAGFLLENLVKEGLLLRRFRLGEARFDGQLKDYAYVVQGLVDLYEADFDSRWLESAASLNAGMLDRFLDPATGTFFDTPKDGEALLIRPRGATDGALPSGTAVAVKNLLRLAALTMDASLRDRAEACLKAYGKSMRTAPLAFVEMLSGVALYLEPPREVAFAGTRGSADLEALVRSYYSRFQPHRVIAFADADESVRALDARRTEWLAGKVEVAGRAAVYLCENRTCEAPITEPDLLPSGR
ncbi:MAG: thioredoxin domain-containing protein [Planctomycetota bacterium]